MAYQSFEELVVWKKSSRLAVNLYNELRGCRDFGLKDQMTRAAVSIPSNIAEGSDRDSLKEFIRFLNIAKGSAAELRTQVYIAQQVDVISNDVAKCIQKELKQISAMLHGLVKSLKRKL